ncbi:pilus assembly PilX family protein [Cerasicoccus maritimus]|uniref:pilus assembly PilX family protein n=1 Tax=Cerasicoccus maritimus TaxID=490089 RepID=UPI0028527903|nr:hypothetical protein [Cerasicoccus maritimus]
MNTPSPKASPSSAPSHQSPQRGFALVIALSLMSFIILLVISMATLVRVELSTEIHTKEQALARQNALFGLQLAIGQLQQQLGPDQAISANAAILDINPETPEFDDTNGEANVKQPYWTGAWSSLQWDAASDRSDSPTLNENSDGKPDFFRAWLVSGFRDSTLTGEDLLNVAKSFDESSANAIQLVGPGTVGSGTDYEAGYVYAPRETIQNADDSWRESGFAYWVGDEGVKANVHADDTDAPVQSIDKINALTSNSRANLRAVENWETLTETDIDQSVLFSNDILKLASVRQLGNADAYAGKFHSLTPYGHGMLIDTAQGGFRQDLSLAFSQNTLPETFLDDDSDPAPIFTLGPENAPIVSGPTWDYVQRFHNRYQMLTKQASGAPVIDYLDARVETFDSLAPDKKGDAPLPVVVRYQYVFSLYKGYNTYDGLPYTAEDQYLDGKHNKNPDYPEANRPNTDYQSNDQIVYLMVNPIYYIWNPYNVAIHMKKDKTAAINFLPSLPNVEFSFDNGNTYKDFNQIFWFYVGEIISLNSSNFELEESVTIPPGEMRLVTLRKVPLIKDEYEEKLWVEWIQRDKFWGDAAAGNANRMQQTTRNFSESIMGLFSPLLLPSVEQPNEMAWHDTKLFATGSGKIHVRIDQDQSKFLFKVNAGGQGGNRQQAGVFHINSEDPLTSAYLPEEYIHDETINFATLPRILDANGDFTGLAPVFTLTFDTRAFDEDNGLGKPGLFTDPANAYYYTEDVDEAALAIAPFRFEFESATASGDYLQFDPGTERAFFRSGADLVYSNVAKELPVTQPLSLGQLEHAPLGRDYDHLVYRYTNYQSDQTPPSELSPSDPRRRSMGPVYNRAVGNGYLHPMLAEDEVWNGGYNVDRSYFLNEVLFNRYYFSGLANNGGPFAENNKTASQRLDDFLAGDKSSINPAYSVMQSEGQSLESIADKVHEVPGEEYLRLAAFLAVEGAFNINSTSVDAWAAMLSASRGQAVMYNDLNAGALAEASDVERTPIISKTFPAGTSAESQSGNYQSANAALWSGFRALTDEQIHDLAKKIVAQVKARGPFLSLGQFFNREISTRDDYNRAGTVQAAIDASGLNTTADDPALKDALLARFDSNEITATDVALATGLPSPDALLGDRNEGLPGYITQAELLKPIMPVLSARSETFLIRSYGDVRDVNGNVTQAWCEAVVQRNPDYVDSAATTSPEPWESPEANSPAAIFGRKFQIISFRWLSEDEV